MECSNRDAEVLYVPRRVVRFSLGIILLPEIGKGQALGNIWGQRPAYGRLKTTMAGSNRIMLLRK